MEDPFIAAIRAMWGKNGDRAGMFIPGYEDIECAAGCALYFDHEHKYSKDGEFRHADDCPLPAAFDALKRHDAAFALAKQIYYNGWDSGGPLHVILDDGNCDPDHLDGCEEACSDPNWSEHGNMIALCRELIAIMRQMSELEIQRVYDRYSEYAK